MPNISFDMGDGTLCVNLTSCLSENDCHVPAVQALAVCNIFCKTAYSRHLSHLPILVCNSGPKGAFQAVRNSNSRNLRAKALMSSQTYQAMQTALNIPEGPDQLEVSSAHSQ